MGKAGVGKTAMRSIIFGNSAAKDTFALRYTHGVSESRLKFMGNMVLNLLDCGGQDEFITQYLSSKKEAIFSNVEILTFVIEAETSANLKQKDDDLAYFEFCVKALNEYSKDSRIFVLINKMDLVASHRKSAVFEKRSKELMDRAQGYEVKCFPTSIWEASLYKAWTEIVYTLITYMDILKKALTNFAEACNSDEVILFEKSTFLLTCHHTSKSNLDDQRFENISNIIKKFKLSCINTKSQFQSMIIKTKFFTAYLEEFTKSTYIMIILTDSSVNQELIKLNIDLSKKNFENIINNQ